MPLDLTALDHEGAPERRPFTIQFGGQIYTLTDPQAMPWQTIASLGADVDHDVHALLGPEQEDAFRQVPLPAWRMASLVDAWREHYSLGEPGRLVHLLHHYGDAISADLADRGWDLAQLWAQRRWRHILSIVHHLPATSHMVTAMTEDEDLAEQLPDPEPGPPPLQTWTPEVEKLTLIADRLGEVVTAVYNTVSKQQSKPPPPLPRPQTARDRLAVRKRRARHELIKRRLTDASTSGRPTMSDALPAGEEFAAVRPRS